MERERERERELQTMIYSECLICQNSWTFLTMIKKTLGKINNTLPFHHIWIIFFLKGNGYFFTSQIVFFFLKILLATILWYFILCFLFFSGKKLLHCILYMVLAFGWFVFWVSCTCQHYPSKIGITNSKRKEILKQKYFICSIWIF